MDSTGDSQYKLSYYTEQLIEAVKIRPFLYDKADVDYKNFFKKTKAWDTIAEELGAENGEIVKEKWKNLRDTYIKHRRSFLDSSCGLRIKRLKNWVWSTQMRFLDKDKDPLVNDRDEPQWIEVTPNILTSSTQDCSSHEGEVSNPNPQRKRKRPEVIENPSCPSTEVDLTASSDKLDKVDYLFLSYADTFKRLNVKRQVALKLELAKLFCDAELASLKDDEVDVKEESDIHFSEFKTEISSSGHGGY